MREDAELGEELSGHGLRATRQRISLLRTLRAHRGHLTAIELHRHMRREHRNLSRKTVYEILSSFVRVGLAACVTDGGEPYLYEAAGAAHYHARCRVCDRLFDLPASADTQIVARTPLPEGFRLEGIQVVLRGVCSRCRDQV
jgi:Fur family peroxide stress response transcriptional regulator